MRSWTSTAKGRAMQEIHVKELDRTIYAPDHWSYTAIRIFADKYLAGVDTNNIFRAIHRVADGVSAGDDKLSDRLYNGMVDQRYAFNSPVFFNVGVEENPQCHACFIQSVDDTMESILELATKEGRLFQHGSGTGTNLSRIRGASESISGGGKPSGPVSFMQVYDAVAGTVKSGGKTRRAAKMQILDIDHPDIVEFIRCKAGEESKARTLIEHAGMSAGIDGEAYGSVSFQNANLSVRVSDVFMDAVSDDQPWHLLARTTGEILSTEPARQLFHEIAKAAWACGDPGIQYHDTINKWNTCPQDGDIVASNPCSEYMFLEETACNLASLNLCAYLREDDSFDVQRFVTDVYDLVTAMDNIIDLAGYPTDAIAEKSKRYRTLGLGFTNLAGLLARMNLSYSSSEARDLAASITALMHFAASKASAELAQARGAYDAYTEAHMGVHRKHFYPLAFGNKPQDLILSTATQLAFEARDIAVDHGFRNAQLTCLAPTGTISFIMDCDTTGIEPYFSRAGTKHLVGGGTLDFHAPDNVELANELTPEQHMLMMAACQPFLSGAISKTINLPHSATVEDIEQVFVRGHELGLKAVAVYRDGCKASQPLVTYDNDEASATEDEVPAAVRHPLPLTRAAMTHKFSVADHDGYLTVGLYDDGRPGEIFVHISKEGSTISGTLDSWAIAVSIALQHGVPLKTIMEKHQYTRFQPAGLTGNKQIPMAHSIIDYIARWMLLEFSEPVPLGSYVVAEDHWDIYDGWEDHDEVEAAGVVMARAMGQSFADAFTAAADNQACPECGGSMQRTGMCWTCPTCGHNGGCG